MHVNTQNVDSVLKASGTTTTESIVETDLYLYGKSMKEKKEDIMTRFVH